MATVVARSRPWQQKPFVTEGRLRLTPIDHAQEWSDKCDRLRMLLDRKHISPERRAKLQRRLDAQAEVR